MPLVFLFGGEPHQEARGGELVTIRVADQLRVRPGGDLGQRRQSGAALGDSTQARLDPLLWPRGFPAARVALSAREP
jgi:hypothetical protein